MILNFSKMLQLVTFKNRFSIIFLIQSQLCSSAQLKHSKVCTVTRLCWTPMIIRLFFNCRIIKKTSSVEVKAVQWSYK
jgi:hypothetical protein